jgi:hypothetical protein
MILYLQVTMSIYLPLPSNCAGAPVVHPHLKETLGALAAAGAVSANRKLLSTVAKTRCSRS